MRCDLNWHIKRRHNKNEIEDEEITIVTKSRKRDIDTFTPINLREKDNVSSTMLTLHNDESTFDKLLLSDSMLEEWLSVL